MVEKPSIHPPRGSGSVRMPLLLHLEGPAVARHRLSVKDLILFVGQLQVAVDRVATVLHGEVDSLQPGRKLAEIESACSLEVTRLEGGGSIVISCDLPFRPQQTLPGTEDVGEQSLRTLVEGIRDFPVGLESAPLPVGFDKGVLLALRDLGKAFDRGFERMDLDLLSRGTHLEPAYTPAVYQAVVRRIQSPVKNRYEIEGRLLMADFKESGLKCRVHPAVGQPVSCVFEEAQREAVLSALTHFVRVVGEATIVDGLVRELRIQDVEVLDELLQPVPPIPADSPLAGRPVPLDLIRSMQSTPVIGDPAVLYGDFWPADDAPGEFVRTIRRWRSEGDSGEVH